jgi:hypothetical protein
MLEVNILQRTCGDSCQLNTATRLEQRSKREFRIIMRVFNERDKSAEKCVFKQPTFTGYLRRADRVWQCGGKNVEPDKSVRTIVVSADTISQRQQPGKTRRHVRQMQFSTTGTKEKTFTLNTISDNI